MSIMDAMIMKQLDKVWLQMRLKGLSNDVFRSVIAFGSSNKRIIIDLIGLVCFDNFW